MTMQTAVRARRPLETVSPFAADVIAGLNTKPKYLPPKYFYDLAGSALFERITHLPEYYPTRSELGLLQKYAPAITSLFPPGCALVEFGAGASTKARILLRAAASVEAYVPIDISGDFLQQDAARLRRDFPHLAIHPVVADFTTMLEPPAEIAAKPRAGFFPGSTIGNFEPHEAAGFLRQAGAILGRGGGIRGRRRSRQVARYSLSRLQRCRRRHRQIQSQSVGAHQSRARRQFRSGGLRASRLLQSPSEAGSKCISPAQSGRKCGSATTTIEFRAGETIHTENSYKYSIDSFQALAHGSGWSPITAWTDGLFSVHALRMTEDK